MTIITGNDSGKVARWVIQKSASNPVDYDPDLIPSSWKSWLSQTRKDPPSATED